MTGVFAAGHLTRDLVTEELIINLSNIKKDKLLSEYYEELCQYLFELRYQSTRFDHYTQVYYPRPLLRLLGGEILVNYDIYSIHIKGPKNMVRIIAQTLEIPLQS